MATVARREVRTGQGAPVVGTSVVGTSVAGASGPPDACRRPRVDGKFLARGRHRLRVHGVTYGPFGPDAQHHTFPASERAAQDFAAMQAAGINAVRTYDLPSARLLELADQHGINVLMGLPWVDVPYRQHFAFLESSRVRREARECVRHAAKLGQRHSCLLAYCVGNEFPPDIIRWHGARRVEQFLAELADVVKQVDPEGLVTYANYPPTEYLDLSFLDFATFNVYLHDRTTFRRYLLRLQNLVGDRPLLLGELGMDTLRHGESEQAEFLAGHTREAVLAGLAGTYVFSWTDDWHTGGDRIEDWAFGITRADRSPKVAYHALREVVTRSPAELLPAPPRVSVVVCTCNGGRTLDQCLRSLEALDYPDYEVIVIDDGSTDDTRAIVSRFPDVRAVHQENQGLSAARNTGLGLATGSVVAYTDSDCFADPDWLTHLVYQLQRTGAAAVGGPNLSPDDGRLAACVAAAPGQPTHVLESDQVAEHIPGCNMAFRKDALLAINGFDSQFRTAGDDVDVCWRLQQAGYWITFAPGAFVWHHRRRGPRAYLRQQAGYGEAEALQSFKHPARFNARGAGTWRGVLYGASSGGLRLGGPVIYRGVFSTGLFQCLYRARPAHWASLPSTLEWHLTAAALALVALFWPLAWAGVATMLGLSVAVAAVQASQARLPPRYDGLLARAAVAALCYAQPVVRSWARYRTRMFAYRPPRADPKLVGGVDLRMPLTGARSTAYWNEAGVERTDVLGLFVAYLLEHRWGTTLDSGWSDWDVEVYCHPWTVVQVRTAQEDYGGRKRLIRARFRVRPSRYLKALGVLPVVAAVAAVGLLPFPAPLEAWGLLATCAGLWALCLGLWWRGTRRAAQVVAVFDLLARSLGLARCDRLPWEGAVVPAEPALRPAALQSGGAG